MELLVISDIHGSSTALDKILEIYNSRKFDKIIICGDVLYHGPRNPLPEGYNPKVVAEKLNSIKSELMVIRGNCESEVDEMVLEFPVMGTYSYYNVGEHDVFITHGHKYNRENLPPLKKDSILLTGHTHIPTGDKTNDIYFFNPGSISLPKGGFEPSYGILNSESWTVYGLNSEKILIETKF